jgi:hypothetical protein
VADSPESGVALVVTDGPVQINVAPLEDERTPEGMVCLGTRVDGRLIARCVVPLEVADLISRRAILQEPVPLALAVKEADPGLQCRLFAVVDLPPEALAEEDEEPEPPWASSVPSSKFDELSQSGSPESEHQRVAVLLGHIVRFAKDRRHPENLPLEAADVLATLVQGRASEVVDKVIEDLLDPG